MGHLEHVSCLKISSSFQILFGRELLVACLILHKLVGCVTLRHQSSKGFLFISMVVASRLSACHFAAYTQRSLLQVGFLQDLCVFALGIPSNVEPRHNEELVNLLNFTEAWALPPFLRFNPKTLDMS
jgi:hypothetical protein